MAPRVDYSNYINEQNQAVESPSENAVAPATTAPTNVEDNLAEGSVENTSSYVSSFFGSRTAQFVGGTILGTGLHMIYAPITELVLRPFGVSLSLPDEYYNPGCLLGRVCSASSFFDICIFAPVVEEVLFRGMLQPAVKTVAKYVFILLGANDEFAERFARIHAIVITAIAFGLMHFANAFAIGCSPMLFLPQVVATTVMGIFFGIAKEYTDSLSAPIGLHMGNNIVAYLAHCR